MYIDLGGGEGAGAERYSDARIIWALESIAALRYSFFGLDQ